jgi:polyhydroxybutyrate depolymerase
MTLHKLTFNLRTVVCLAISLAVSLLACSLRAGTLKAGEAKLQEWTVQGVKREALVVKPQDSKSAPVVFVFHGHGGTMKNSSQKMDIHTHWPEAVCIYPQGLNTAGRLTDPQGNKPGWQAKKGDEKDRDLEFFDAMLEWAKKEHKIDEKIVFSTGHSNGGGFTYLLLANRGDKLTAIAPSASASLRDTKNLKEKPMIVFAAENDPLVKYEWQKSTIDAMKKINGVDSKGQPWHDVKNATVFNSAKGSAIVTVLHSYEHKYPEEAPKLTARFFKEISSK